MKQRWWIALVAVVGIALAVLLIPRPDTGEDVASVIPTNSDPLAFNAGDEPKPATSGAVTRERPADGPRPVVSPDRVMTGPKPGMEDRIAKKNMPEALSASKLITPFSAIRYTLLKMEGNAPAQALAEEITAIQIEINEVKNSPDTADWTGFQNRMDAMIGKVAASPFASDATINTSLGRYKEFIAEYHEAKAGGGAAPANPAGVAP